MVAKQAERLPLSPDVLHWARSSAGYDIDSAAKAIGVSPTRILEWESGSSAPTLIQLRRLAERYNRSLAALMLQEPPDEQVPSVVDYRAHAGQGQGLSFGLRRAVVRAERQREAVLEMAEATDSVPDPRPLALTIERKSGPEAAGDRIRAFLRLDELSDKERLRPRDALSKVIATAEDRDVLVIQTQRIPLTEMRGFSVSAEFLPVIALNGSDAPRGKLFTLLHEAAHIGLRAGGVCDLHEARATESSSDLEDFCNSAAASALMSRSRLVAAYTEFKSQGAAWTAESMRELGSTFGASAEAVLLRLISLQLEGWPLYRQLKPQIDEAVAAARHEEEGQRRDSTGGPSFYVMKTRDLGRAYISRVIHAFDDDAISSRDAARFLDVRFDQLPQLRKAAGE